MLLIERGEIDTALQYRSVLDELFGKVFEDGTKMPVSGRKDTISKTLHIHEEILDLLREIPPDTIEETRKDTQELKQFLEQNKEEK